MVESATLFSNNTNLEKLVIAEAPISPMFTPDNLNYSVSVPYSITNVSVIPKAQDIEATVNVNGKSTTSGQSSEPINLNIGENTITIKVTAEDNISQKEYKVNLIRASTLNSQVKEVSGKANHTLALLEDGTVWAWGWNDAGMLGSITNPWDRSNIPIKVPVIENIKSVSAGTYHSVALDNNGTVWTWGSNFMGQLGDGTIKGRLIPNLISNLNGVKEISAGFLHTLALKEDGTVWAWGNNSHGQVGDGSIITKYSPTQVIDLSNIKAVSAGREQSIVLKEDGTVLYIARKKCRELQSFLQSIATKTLFS